MNSLSLSHIDQIVDSTAWCERLSFVNAYSGYHQVWIAEEDQPRTIFITPDGTYCYMIMPFGLCNAGATFTRLVQIVFHDQISRNLEAYVDDIVTKSQKENDLVTDLRETFDNLRKSMLRLNPKKCTVGVRSRKLLGYLVSQWEIEANPE